MAGCSTYCKGGRHCCSWTILGLNIMEKTCMDAFLAALKYVHIHIIRTTKLHHLHPPQHYCICMLDFNHKRVCKAAAIMWWGDISLSHYGLTMLISLLRGRGACVWIDSPGQSSVRTQWTTTKELISNQLPTCFCPAPFIWLVRV